MFRVMVLQIAQRYKFPEIDRRKLPIIIGNSMAKSGSHLLSQFLEGICEFSPLVFTDVHPIRLITPEGKHRSDADVLADIIRLGNGDIGWGYIPAREPYLSALSRENVAHIFLYRDPRDKIISSIFYALEIHEGHAMRSYYQSLPDFEACINATIEGVPSFVEDIRTVYQSCLTWLECENVLTIRFEDLVGERQKSLDTMLDFLMNRGVDIRFQRDAIISSLNLVMSPERSPTFRKGESGGWKKYFTPSNVELMKQVSGDLLMRLGYEESAGWKA